MSFPIEENDDVTTAITQPIPSKATEFSADDLQAILGMTKPGEIETVFAVYAVEDNGTGKREVAARGLAVYTDRAIADEYVALANDPETGVNARLAEQDPNHPELALNRVYLVEESTSDKVPLPDLLTVLRALTGADDE